MIFLDSSTAGMALKWYLRNSASTSARIVFGATVTQFFVMISSSLVLRVRLQEFHDIYDSSEMLLRIHNVDIHCNSAAGRFLSVS